MATLGATAPLCVLLAVLSAGHAHAAQPEPTDDSSTTVDLEFAAKADAKRHFDAGVRLEADQAWDAALVEFMTSRRIYKTRAATRNAAVCLRRLQRFDESLEMFELLLTEFPDMPPQERTRIEKELDFLRGTVGALTFRQGERGVSVQVDGRDRGTLPLPAPLTVSAGQRVVRLYKRGFAPWVERIEVAPRATVEVAFRLDPLIGAGQLRVVEQQGAVLDVLVDGVVVGQAPWEGPVAPGRHTVHLSGEGELGTQPVSIAVRKGRLEKVTLAAERLAAWLSVAPTPLSAAVLIDGESVGSGVWSGRLRAGGHRVEVVKPGFSSARRDITLEDGSRQRLEVSLERIVEPEAEGGRFVLGGDVAFAVSPTLGGDAGDVCKGDCRHVPALGASALLRLAYELPIGFSFGVELGAIVLHEAVSDRPSTVVDTLLVPHQGEVDELRTLVGGMAGVVPGFRLGDAYPVTLRIAVGALIGELRTRRRGDFTSTTSGSPFSFELRERSLAPLIYVAPEVRLAVVTAGTFELDVGARGTACFALVRPAWPEDDGAHATPEGNDVVFQQPDALVSRVIFTATAGLGMRYAF